MDVNGPLLTFVVPCYNVEKYIQRCLDSIYACDLPEEQFEVICINDCSPDGTQAILEENQKCHENIRIVVHERNKGLGGGRNTGIREAKGEYLWFIDADDSITAQKLHSVMHKAEEERLDVLCFNYRRVDEEGRPLSEFIVFGDTQKTDGYSFVNSVFGTQVVAHVGFVWRFIYRTDYLRSHRLFFPENVCWEDTVYMPKSLIEANSVASVPDVLYSYRVNANSISGTFTRVYPAKLIFEFAFCAGGDLLRFSNGVKDERLKEAFHSFAIQKYINGFSIHLFRASKNEREKFFSLLRERKEVVGELKVFMKPFSKVLLAPFWGGIVADFCSVLYGIKHKKNEHSDTSYYLQSSCAHTKGTC